MKPLRIALLLCVITLFAQAQTSKTPINNGILQSDLDAAGFKILSANLADYAGANMTWNSVTGKFDATLAGSTGSDLAAPLNLYTTASSVDPVTHPFTALNSGIFVKDANNVEVLRLWASNPSLGTVNARNLYIGKAAGLAQPSSTPAGTDNTGIGYTALTATNSTGNTAVGSLAMQFNTTGYGNVAVGWNALNRNDTLEGSTAVGATALQVSRQTGLSYGGDTAIGFGSLYQLSGGGDNVAVGRYSGNSSISDGQMVFLGEFASRTGSGTLQNGIAVGYAATIGVSNTATIGNGSITDVYFGGNTETNAILRSKGASFKTVTVATLPASPIVGQVATVSDGAASLAFGATVTGGGSTNYQVWWNGSAWKVTGGGTTAGGGSNSFGTVVVSGQSDVVADAAPDMLTLAAGSNITLTTNATTDTVTIAATGGGGGAPTTSDYLVGTADAGLSAEIVVGTSPGGELGGTWASPTLDDGITVANWTLTTPQIAAISNLTTNGFVKTGGAIGTLSVDTATYQPSDADLTTWAGITPVAAVGTWIATPSSANLRAAMTDESGTGVLLFSGAASPIFSGATQFWNGATSSGEIRILEDSDFGTNYASFVLPAAGITATTAYILPPDDGNSGEFLQTNGTGTLIWAAPAGGGTVTSTGTSPNIAKFSSATNITNAVAGTDYQAALGVTPTTVGLNFIDLANPGAITFPKITALNDVVAESAATFLTSIGAQASDADLTTWAGITPTTVGQSFVTLANPGAITFPEISATNVVSAKTAAQLKTDLSLTATDVGLGNVTNNAQTQAAIVPNTAPSAGQILIGNAGNTAYAKNSLSGSGATMSLGATGVLTISAIPESSLSITDLTTGNATTSAHGFAPKGTVGTTQFWRQDWTLATPGGTGTVTATGGALTANSVVLGAGTTDTKVVGGIISDGTSKLTLGVSTTSVGSIDFKNLTSGTVTISPTTGALGTVTMNLPAANSTAAQAKTSTASQWLNSMSAQGVFTATQPAFTDITGSVAATQMPALTGDVTTTAGAVATTIGANKVTLGMMATMATDSILGRKTAATGNVEVLTALPWADTGDVTRAADGTATVLANIPLTTTIAGAAGTRGDVLYYGASGWAKLGAGTSGQQLTTGGAGADPSWAAAGSGGGGTPGGSNTQVQFNDSSAFGGDNTFIWDKTTDKLSLGVGGGASGWVTSPSTEMVMEQTGDTYGTVRLRLQNRGGSNGALFENAGLDLIDMGFKPSTGPQALIRVEHRGSSMLDSTNNANGEFHFVENTTATAVFSHVLGPARSYLGGITAIGPTATTGAQSLTIDTAFSRNAAGVMEINNGTAGTYRDLKLRNLILSGGTQIPAASPTGQFLKDDGTYATPAGGAGGTPGGSTTQVQYNNAGAFGGDAAFALTLSGTSYSSIQLTGSGGVTYQFAAAGSAGLGGYFAASELAILNQTSTNAVLLLSGNNVLANSAGMFGWQNAGRGGTIDTGFYRNAAGVIEVNNGTAGQYRDIKVDEVDAVTGYKLNGTTIALDYSNTSVTSQTPSTSDVYLAGSNIVIPAGGFKASGQYRCLFDVVKSAGTGGIVLTVRIGTLGTTGDTNRMTFTFPAGTSVADTGNMEVIINWRTVGGGTSAVISGLCRAFKNTITAAGLWNDTSAAKTIVGTVSGGFDSSTATTMGVSFNGGTAFAGTITTVQSNLFQK